MDIGKSFTYMFEDPNWIAKIGIGGAILLVGTLFSFLIGIPILVAAAILLGYSLTATKNVADGVTMPLPEWNDFGALFMKGLYALIGIIVVFIPAIVLICCFVIITSVLGSAAASSSDQGTSSAASSAIGIVAICLQCLYILYAIIASIYLYAPLTRYAMNGQLNTFWDFSGNLAFIRANAGNYIIAFLLGPIVASGIIAQFGIIACVIGVFFTSFWGQLVSAHLFGQVYRLSTGQAPMASSMPPYAPPPMTPTTPT